LEIMIIEFLHVVWYEMMEVTKREQEIEKTKTLKEELQREREKTRALEEEMGTIKRSITVDAGGEYEVDKGYSGGHLSENGRY
jgi:hypothetical protein